jgi:hypothetical protein
MRTRLVLYAIAALAMSGEALADGVSYRYLQANVVLSQLTKDGGAMTGSGLGLEGAAGIGPYLFAFGSYNSNSYAEKYYNIQTNTHVKIRLRPGTVGAGGRLPLGSALDLFGGASLERVKYRFSETDTPNFTETFNGWGATLGLRGWFSDTIQWDIALKYSDMGDLKTVLGYSFSGRYYFRADYSFGVDIGGRKYDDKTLNFNESLVAIVFRHDFGVRF